MDGTSILGLALAYFATMVAVVIMILPLLIPCFLLLLLAGAARLVILLLTAMTVWLSRSVARMFRSLTGRSHRGHRGSDLVPH